MDLHDVRRDYERATLSRNDIAPSPFEQFASWLSAAHQSGALSDPTAMTIATVNAAGSPRQRTVLLKQNDSRGLVFFTNLTSMKAQDLAQNPAISAHFSWLALEQQVSVEGRVELLPRHEVEKYFHSRPRESQLSAWASQQSQTIDSRASLEATYKNLSEQYQGKEIPVPEHWGGYRIVPHRFEFWQGGKFRLHDRFEYVRTGNDWHIQRLQP